MRIPKIIALVGFALLSAMTTAQAQYYPGRIPITGTTTPTAFDEQFVNLMKRWRIPGASVAVIRNGQFVLTRGYGWADLQAKRAVEPQDLFRIGSVSKAITAVTILKLAEQGKIKLDESAFRVLSDVTPLGERPNPGIYQITVKNLLQMSSGWQTSVIDPMFGPWTSRMLNELQGSSQAVPPDCHTAARLMMGSRFQFRPGTSFSYSNINYCLLGMLANKVTGNPYDYRTYEAYVKQNILGPLGISNMRIGDTLLQNRAPNEVHYYSYSDLAGGPNDIAGMLARVDGLPYSNSQILKKNYADGGWIASSMDLARFLYGVSSHRILSQRMVDVMLEKPGYLKKDNGNYFAMGWTVKRINGHLYWYKTGSFTGTYAFLMQGDNGTSYAAVFNTKPGQRAIFIPQLRRVLVMA